MASEISLWRKENTLTHRPYSLISLLEARDKRDVAKKLLPSGKDPSQVKKDEKLAASINAATTFELVTREWHELNKEHWSRHYAMDILHRLEAGIFLHLGKRPINDVTAPHPLDALRRIERRGAVKVAHRTLQFCGQVFRYAIVTGRLARNPATDLRGALRPSRHERFAALDTRDLPGFLRALERNDGRLYAQTRCAIRMLMLTFVHA